MKFMKLGSKPDAFRADGSSTRYVASDLGTDIIVVVEVTFFLHKFPLLSKSCRLQKLVKKTKEVNSDEVQLRDFPGGAKAFEICAKFCYGMTVILNAYNVVFARCAAEYLEMTEAIERGNLIYKIEVFLSSSVFRSWKDSIIVLQTTKSLLPWSEDLKIIGRCIDSISSKTSVDPSKVEWSYTYNRKKVVPDTTCVAENGVKLHSPSPKDWWIEDTSELEIELYKRLMISIKSKGRMSDSVIGEALKVYILRWLPDFMNLDTPIPVNLADFAERNRSLVEAIIWLLPSGQGVCCSCSFLLKLLKVAVLLGTSEGSRQDLARRVGCQLDQASVKDLLIPCSSAEGTIYDVDLMQNIVDRFMLPDRSKKNPNHVQGNEDGMEHMYVPHESSQKVGRLIDCYLAEVAHDPNLSVHKFVTLSVSPPDSARPCHDDLYRAIDIYLKEHLGLSKEEKKSVCGLMDVKRLSMDASIHAAQNERLPLRVVVQVLFYEQVRASTSMPTPQTNIKEIKLIENVLKDRSSSVKDVDGNWKQTIDGCQVFTREISSLKITDDKSLKDTDNVNNINSLKKSNRKGGFLLPSRSRKIFDKLWISKGHGDGKNADDSGSPENPISLHPGESKSVASTSRNRRHSVS